MITEKSRRDLGFTDNFGYVYSQNDEPLAQLHVDENSPFATLFWRGTTTLSGLEKAFRSSIREFSGALNIPEFKLNRAEVHYASRHEVTSLPYLLKAEVNEEDALLNQHSHFLRERIMEIIFARFDIESKDPLILWGDLVASKDSEVGFSSVLLLDSAVQFLVQTSIRKPSNRDVDALIELVDRHMSMQREPIRGGR